MKHDLQCRGANTWRKLCAEHKVLTGQRIQGLITRVFSPTKAKKKEEIKAHIETWGILKREYEEATSSKLPQVAQLHALRSIVPGEMEKDMIRINFEDYEKAKSYIMEQLNLRATPVFGETSKTPKDAAVPMDMNHVSKGTTWWPPGFGEGEQEPSEDHGHAQQHPGGEDFQQGDGSEDSSINYMGKGGKGKGGKGKGGKGFQGACWNCGKVGHSMRNCPEPLQEHLKGKGN